MADCTSRGFLHAVVLPLAGLGKDWSPVLAHEEEFHEGYPGYVTSKNGPKAKEHGFARILNCFPMFQVIHRPELNIQLGIKYHRPLQ